MEGQGCPYLYKKKYPLAMESKDELRKRIEELEYGLAQAKWQSDLDRQISEQKEYARELKKKEDGYFYWALAIFIVLPFLYLWLK
jgi:hypothetical protein